MVGKYLFQEKEIRFFKDDEKGFFIYAIDLGKALKISRAAITYHFQKMYDQLEKFSELMPSGHSNYKRIFFEKGVYIMCKHICKDESDKFSTFFKTTIQKIKEEENLKKQDLFTWKKDESPVPINQIDLNQKEKKDPELSEIKDKIKKLFLPKDIARMFGVKLQDVNEWLDNGILKHITIGNIKFIPKNAIVELVESYEKQNKISKEN